MDAFRVIMKIVNTAFIMLCAFGGEKLSWEEQRILIVLEFVLLCNTIGLTRW